MFSFQEIMHVRKYVYNWNVSWLLFCFCFFFIVLKKCVSKQNVFCVCSFILKNEIVHDIFFIGLVARGLKQVENRCPRWIWLTALIPLSDKQVDWLTLIDWLPSHRINSKVTFKDVFIIHTHMSSYINKLTAWAFIPIFIHDLKE